MRIPWIDEKQQPDYPKLRRYECSHISRSIRDPLTTPASLQADRDQGFGTSLYFAWNWYPDDNYGALADRISSMLQTLAPGSTPGDPRVCCDIEVHSVPFVLAFFKRWRQHRPNRVTDFAFEGYQGGLYTPANTLELAARHLYYQPGFYTGDMQPLAADRVVLDLVAHSFAPGMIYGFYDGARLPIDSNGYIFTQARMP